MTHRGYRQFALAITASVVLVGMLATAPPVSNSHPTTTPTPTLTTTPQPTDTACQRNPVSLDVDASLSNTTTLTEKQAWNLAASYEAAYAPEHTETPRGATTGIGVQASNITKYGNGYLIRLDMIFGGTYNVTVNPDEVRTTQSTPIERIPQTTQIFFDYFYRVYYYVSPTRIVRHEQSDPPATPRTDGVLLACQPPRTQITTTSPSTTTTPSIPQRACENEPALDVDTTFPPLTLNASTAADVVATYEHAYKAAHVETPERGDASIVVQDTNVTTLARGYLVKAEAVYGGTFVITVRPPDPATTTQPAAERTSRTPLTTVGHFDDFYTVYYYVSENFLIRHDQRTPPADPRTGGTIIACEPHLTTTTSTTE